MRGIIPYSVFLICVFVFIGCSIVRKSVDNYEACKADPECVGKMYAAGNATSVLVSSSIPVAPIANPIGEVAGLVVSALVGVFLGRKSKRCL